MAPRSRLSRRQRSIFHFEVLPFTRTANGKTVQRLRKSSMRFKKAFANGDTDVQGIASRDAWSTMHDLTLLIRKAEDNGAAAHSVMPSDTGWIAEDLSLVDQQSMMSCKKVNRKHLKANRCSLRKCLNKLAHSKTTTFRVDGRGSHYLVLTGPDQSASKGPWVCEFNVNTFATHCANVIRLFP